MHGLITDDDFRIVQITSATVLVEFAAGVGGVTGALYMALRSSLPRRGRATMWGAGVGLFTSADVLMPDKFDFAALEPKPFIVTSFGLPLSTRYRNGIGGEFEMGNLRPRPIASRTLGERRPILTLRLGCASATATRSSRATSTRSWRSLSRTSSSRT